MKRDGVIKEKSMGFVITLIILYNIFGKSNPKVYHKVHSGLPKIIGGLIALSVLGSAIPALLGLSIGLLFAFSPFIAIGWLVKTLTGNKKRALQYEESKYTGSRGGTSLSFENKLKTPLPKSVRKRRKIVDKFNKRFDLTLSDAEIDRIVDASYASIEWEVEIYAMTKEMTTINEWYRGDTAFVRAYMKAFYVQQISSDFAMQERICFEAFDQIMRETKPERFASIDACVEYINNTFMTGFDEQTFMIAYRYLEKKGRRYKLPRLGVARNDGGLSDLMSKYDGEDLYDTASAYDEMSMDDLAEMYDSMDRSNPVLSDQDVEVIPPERTFPEQPAKRRATTYKGRT